MTLASLAFPGPVSGRSGLHLGPLFLARTPHVSSYTLDISVHQEVPLSGCGVISDAKFNHLVKVVTDNHSSVVFSTHW